jgi:hypothetical protein
MGNDSLTAQRSQTAWWAALGNDFCGLPRTTPAAFTRTSASAPVRVVGTHRRRCWCGHRGGLQPSLDGSDEINLGNSSKL